MSKNVGTQGSKETGDTRGFGIRYGMYSKEAIPTAAMKSSCDKAGGGVELEVEATAKNWLMRKPRDPMSKSRSLDTPQEISGAPHT